MKSGRPILLFFLLFLGRAPAQAETLTLERCLDLAYKNNPDLRAADALLAQSKGELTSVRGRFWPTLTMTSLVQKQSQPPVPINAPGVRPSFANTDVWEHDLTARQTFFAWGGIEAQYKSALAGHGIAQQKRRQARHELRARVRRAFYGYLLAQEKVRIQGEAETVAKSHFETTSARFREGRSTSFDSSQSKVFWINRQTELIRSRNEVKMAESALRRAIGLPQDGHPITVQGDMTYHKVTIQFDPFYQQMLLNRPMLQALALQEKQRENQIRAARALHRPSLSASYTRTWQDVTLRRSFENYNYWNAIGQIHFPIFDGFSSWGKVAAARAAFDETRANRLSELETARLELEEAVLGAQDADERIQAQKENVATAQDNVRIANRRLKLGTISYLEMKDAQLSLTEAEAHYLQALYDLVVALVDIDRIVGADS